MAQRQDHRTTSIPTPVEIYNHDPKVKREEQFPLQVIKSQLCNPPSEGLIFDPQTKPLLSLHLTFNLKLTLIKGTPAFPSPQFPCSRALMLDSCI